MIFAMTPPFQIINSDCLEAMRAMAGGSVDSVVTDPPYGLSFMGKVWDYDVPSADVWREALRVLKPGGHLLSFFGSRTYHRGVVQIEDAGFEIRDCIMWIYGSGFPKSHNLKGDWDGWGTALKPSHEPVVVARKPFPGTVAANVREHGTGALNIAACRVETNEETGWGGGGSALFDGGLSRTTGEARPASGRWPANVVHDGSPEVLAGFPEANNKTGGPAKTSIGGAATYNGGAPRVPVGHDDSGSAARFFYCAKASKADREAGVGGEVDYEHSGPRGHSLNGDGSPRPRPRPRANIHPTVKPTSLMRWLCRLITPPGGVILDPFTGSGSTGKAAILEGFRFIGIEREAEYCDIARARIGAATRAQPEQLELMGATP